MALTGLLLMLGLVGVFRLNIAVELTFELADNARECFHEEIHNATKCTLEFQARFLILYFIFYII